MAVFATLSTVAFGILIWSRWTFKHKWAVFAAVPLPLVALWYFPRQGMLVASGVPHATVNLALLLVFGGSLLPGREPVATALARKIRGRLDGEIAVYTRRVTWAWTFFFAGQLVASLALFVWAPIADWSLFVNVLSYPLIVLMFAAEYSFRLVHMRHHRPSSLWATIRVLAQGRRE